MNPDVETYEGEDPDAPLCEICGEPFDQLDNLHSNRCPGCDDWSDMEGYFY
jgi:hypothetical protein